MLTKGAIGNLVNRYKAVLAKCNLINTFGSLAVASMLVLGGAGVASAAPVEKPLTADWTETLTSPATGINVESGAYAVTLTNTSNETGKKHVLENASIKGTGNITLISENGPVLYTTTTTLEGDMVTLQSKATKSSAIASYGTHTINANNILVEAGGDALQGSSDMSGNVTLTATDTITIRSTGTDGEAIQAFKGQFNLKAKTIILESVGGQAIAQRGVGSTVIEADDVVIKAYEGGRVDDKLHAVRVGEGTLTFKVANSLTVTDNGSDGTAALGVDGDNGKLIIEAPKATIDGNIDAAKGEVQLDGNLIFEGDKAEIATLTGEKATFTVTDAAQEVSIDNNSNNDLDVVATGEVNDAVGGDASKLNVTINGEQVAATDNFGGMEEGFVAGAVDENGKMAKNTLMDAALRQASVTTVALDKILTNDVRKRLGDIRSDKNTTGVWMRWDGGKLQGNGLSNDFNTIQIGGDTKVGKNCRLGVAGTFTHGDAEFARGNAELEGFTFAAYATWMGENGMFADVVARLGQFSNEMYVEGRTGDMDNRVFSLSGEYGWRLPVLDQFFIEPQVELAYTYVSSDSLELGTAKYAFDSVNSLTGRAGVVFGWNLPDDRGNVYARASVLQQFMGDAKISGAVTGGKALTQEIDGNDTWLEYGIGANVKLTDNTYIWADVERTEGADIDEEWRGTVGIRYSF